MTPTRRSLALLGAGLAFALLPAFGVAGAWPWIVAGWVLGVAVLVADAAFSARTGDLEWTLDTPSVLYVGESGPATLTWEAPSPRPMLVRATLDLSDVLAPQAESHAIAGPEGVRLSWPLTPSRRGRATVEALWLGWRSPAGLWAHSKRVPLDREIPVLPDLPRVRAQAIRFFADRHFRAGLQVERYRGDGSEFDSLKEYLPGDDHRTIDWKATARHRRPICRQHRAERDHQVIFAIDSGRLMSESVAGVSRLDHAINGALLLSYVCLATGDRVGLFSFHSRPGPALEPVRGVAGIRALLESTARIDYSADETNFTLGLTTLAQRLRRRSLVVLLTDFVDTVTAELLVENADRIASRHLLVFLSIRDPMLGELVRTPPTDMVALGRAVMARQLERDRSLVHRRLRRSGVRTFDVAPDAIAPSLIQQYLDIKRRERI
ncbi:MAG: DUF58 domain-containing protein [Candidatus Eisenbacteria bacterium]|uniref:DUF58 domain-containing protein n=1 Tax=Eiseniibacteriota bacterium TaxID=2212470 RepID=A0A933W9S3_UNCEI|nr:DUF58 domain-containing protein [Candidatus Eisenbacteria bacterium]